MADKAKGNISASLRALKATPDLPPEVYNYLTRILRASAAGIDPAKLPGADLARVSVSIDQARVPLARLLAEHPALRRYLAGPVGVLARIEAGEHSVDQKPAAPLSPREQTAVIRQRTIRSLLAEGKIPGDTVTWNSFYDMLRDRCDGWRDRKKGASRRGYGNTIIKTDVVRLKREK
jgi:hypothetical protein